MFTAVCPIACEHACARELALLGCSSIEAFLGYCRFECDDIFFVLRYVQTASHILEDFDALRESFRVTAITGSRSDERRIGAELFERFGVPVDLSDPYMEIGVVEDQLGVILNGFDYSLREYKVYRTPRSLNPCVAASIIYGLDIPLDGAMCDPLSHDGVVPIEFALAAHAISPRKFQERTLASRYASHIEDARSVREGGDTLVLALEQNANYLRRAQHNARLAGVDVEFSRYDLDWLDMRLEGSSITTCMLELPHLTSKTRGYERILENVRFAADHMLTDDGELVVITNDPLVEFDGFIEDRRMVVPRGELALYALAFRRV